MDRKHERIINDWISSTEDAIAALQGWLDSLREWRRNDGRELTAGDFMVAFRRMVELMGDEWVDANPCDIDKLAAVVPAHCNRSAVQVAGQVCAQTHESGRRISAVSATTGDGPR